MDWGGMKRFIDSISLPSKEDKEGGFGRKGAGVECWGRGRCFYQGALHDK